MTEQTVTHILVVDDDAQVRASVGRLLEREGYSCTLAADAEEARRRLPERGFALLLCDVHMPGGSGFTLVREAVTELPGLAALVLTGDYHLGLPDIARDCGASGFLSKPFKPEQLFALVDRALEGRGAQASAAREREPRSDRDISPKERLRVVAEALCGESSVAEVCRRNGISESLYRAWHDRALRAVGGQLPPGGDGSFERALARRTGAR